MPHFTLPLDDKGPILNVLLTVSEAREAALVKLGQGVPEGVVAKGLVDTGASCTCVDPSVIQSLEISPSGEARMFTPSTVDGAVPTYQYDLGLYIYAQTVENPYKVRNLPVVEAPLLQQQGFHALIGRDVLSKCILVYNGTTSTYMLAF